MPKSRIIVTIGVVVALLPVLGFPRAWEEFFQVVAGLSIVIFTLWTAIDRKLTLKAKAQKRQAHKRLMNDLGSQAEVQTESGDSNQGEQI